MARAYKYKPRKRDIVHRVEVLRKKRGWYFRTVSKNGRILTRSEDYSSSAKCTQTAVPYTLQLGVTFIVKEEKR